MNLAAFKDPAYTVYCLSAFTVFLGIYTGWSLSFLYLSAVLFERQIYITGSNQSNSAHLGQRVGDAHWDSL